MQACLRPFAVRSSSWARLSRSATPTTLTRLGRRNFAVPSEESHLENSTARDLESASSSDSADHPAGGSKGLDSILAAAREHDTLAGEVTLDEVLGPPGPLRPQGFDVETEPVATFNDLRKRHRLRTKQKWAVEGASKRRESATPIENPALGPSTQPEHDSSGSPAPRPTRPKKCFTCGGAHRQADCPKAKCYKCGDFGHISENCPRGQRVCNNCKQPGHEYSACPSRRTKNRSSGGEVKGESANKQQEVLAKLRDALSISDEAIKTPIPSEDDAALTLARPPPHLVFGSRAAKRWEAARTRPPPVPRATPSPKSARFAETDGPPPLVKYIIGAAPAPSPPALPAASVVLMPLPPFTTLADVSRIALRAGAAPGDVMGVKLWVNSKRERGDSAPAQHTAATEEEGKDKPTGEKEDFRVDWTLGATINFRTAELARAFRATPLLLEAYQPRPRPPPQDPRAARTVAERPRPRVRVFPPAEHAGQWAPAELVRLQGLLEAGQGGPGAADAEAGDAATATATEESTAAGQAAPAPADEVVDLQQPDSAAAAGDEEQVLRQRAEVLKSMWGRLETTLDPSGTTARHVDVAASDGEQEAEAEAEAEPARTEMSTGAPEASLENPLPVSNPEEGHAHLPERPEATADGATDVAPTGWGRHPIEQLAGISKDDAATDVAEADGPEALILRARKLLPPESVIVSVPLKAVASPLPHTKLREEQTRWLALRVPGAGVPAFAPPEPYTTEPDASAAVAEEEEHEDPKVQLYATALRKALARERELEADLRRARTATQEHALEAARVAAEAQVRADFGVFGALEGVWVRCVRVPAHRAPSRGAAPEADSDAGSGPGYDDAVDTKDGREWVYEMHALVAFADGVAAGCARTVVPVQLPAYADMGVRFMADPWPEALTGRRRAAEGPESPDGAREGWARRLDREQRAEARAREREKERERQRGAAVGTWGKENLSEVRERLRRAKRRAEWEQEREAAWARARARQAELQTEEAAGASAVDGTDDTISDEDWTSSELHSDSTSTSSSSGSSDSEFSDSDSGSDSESSDSDSGSESESESTPSEPSASLPYVARF